MIFLYLDKNFEIETRRHNNYNKYSNIPTHIFLKFDLFLHIYIYIYIYILRQQVVI